MRTKRAKANSESPTGGSHSLRLLPLLKHQIIISVEALAKNLEVYLQNTSQDDARHQCFRELDQIEGCFYVLELPGLYLFVSSLKALAHQSLLPNARPPERQVNALTRGFFLIHRYLEFLNFSWRDTPELLIPDINRLCQLLNRSLYPISYFSKISIASVQEVSLAEFNQSFASDLPPKTLLPSNESLDDALRRFRLMYQIGLLSVLSQKDVSSGCVLLRHAVKHLLAYSRYTELLPLWVVANGLITAFSDRVQKASSDLSGGLVTLSFGVLCDLEKSIRRWQQEGDDYAAQSADPKLMKEMIYWLALEESPSPVVVKILNTYQVPKNKNPRRVLTPFPSNTMHPDVFEGIGAGDAQAEVSSLTHHDLWRFYTLFQGPSLQTRRSVVELLKNDLNQMNNTLEAALKNEVAEYTALLATQLRTVAETLKLLELNRVAEHLNRLCQDVEGLQAQKQTLSRALLESIADALILTENAIQEFAQVSSSTAATDERDAAAELQLHTAEQTLLSEIEHSLQAAKMQLNRFSDSGYQFTQMDGIQARFNEMVGGLKVLQLPRALAIVEACSEFVSVHLTMKLDPALLAALLDTFADVIVSLEFYLHGVSQNKRMDERILGVAEQSLDALGVTYGQDHSNSV